MTADQSPAAVVRDDSHGRCRAIESRLRLIEEDIRNRPFSHPVTEAWYHEDVSWLLRELERERERVRQTIREKGELRS